LEGFFEGFTLFFDGFERNLRVLPSSGFRKRVGGRGFRGRPAPDLLARRASPLYLVARWLAPWAWELASWPVALDVWAPGFGFACGGRLGVTPCLVRLCLVPVAGLVGWWRLVATEGSGLWSWAISLVVLFRRSSPWLRWLGGCGGSVCRVCLLCLLLFSLGAERWHFGRASPSPSTTLL
jgi:hypothetical protein